MTDVCKLVLVGNGSVGKSSILEAFVGYGFNRVYKQTVGIDFLEKQILLRGTHCERKVQLQLWDVGGQSISSQMLPRYIYGAAAVLVCYDVTDFSSFVDTSEWLDLINSTLSAFEGSNKCSFPEKLQKTNRKLDKKNVKIFLVGNKIDLLHLRQVSKEDHENFAKRNNLDGSCFVSAKSGENIVRTFYKVGAASLNISVSEHELQFTDKVLSATIVAESEEKEDTSALPPHIAAEIARIEKEDLEAEERKNRRASQSCNGCSLF